MEKILYILVSVSLILNAYCLWSISMHNDTLKALTDAMDELNKIIIMLTHNR